jgi:hypothetical protein
MRILLGLLFIATSALAQSVGDTLHYTINISGNKAGTAWLTQPKAGEYVGFLEYNDRGRGPRSLTKYRFDATGQLRSFEISGYGYMKEQVSERFSLEGNIAKWSSTDETKEVKVNEAVTYLSNSEGTDNVLLQSLLATPSKQVTLLPAVGVATLRLVKEHTCKNGKLAKLWAIAGLGFTPRLVWADEAGQGIGANLGWFVTVRQGYEADVADLQAIMQAETDQFFGRLAQKLTQKPTHGVAITNVRVFDAEKATMLPNLQTVLVRDGKIQSVSERSKVPDNYRIIDGTGKTLLPGLWDMHGHYSGGEEGLLHLACGVTSLRDMGNDDKLLTVRQQIDRGDLIGPRIAVMSGFIDGKGPFTGPIGRPISTADEGIAAVKDYASKGYQQIKLYSSIKPEWVKPIAAEAHRLKLRVAGHIPAYMTAEQAIAAGYDEITHTNMMFLNFYGDSVDTRSMQRFTLVAKQAATLDVESAAVRRFATLLQERGIAFDPTVTIFEGMFTNRTGQNNPYAAIIHRLPVTVQRDLTSGLAGGLPVPMGMNEVYRSSFQKMLQLIKKLHDTGVLMVAGTDGFAGFTLQREIELYSQAGIPNGAAIQMATYNAAKLSKRLDDLGTIEKGKIADLVLIDGDPTTTISDIRKVILTIKDGNIYASKDLLKAISVKNYDEAK